MRKRLESRLLCAYARWQARPPPAALDFSNGHLPEFSSPGLAVILPGLGLLLSAVVTSSPNSLAPKELLPPGTFLKGLGARRRSGAPDFTNSTGVKCQAVVRPLQK